MQPDRADRIAEIVELILEVDPPQRATLIVELCAGDAELLGEVASLLQYQETARDFIETPAVEKVAGIIEANAVGLKSGETIGAYRIANRIGEGGMGEVYLAEDTDLGRKVALKLIKYGLGTTDFVRHFRQEERILAGLNHPNIAALYGASVTSQGVPFFVMEYVDGLRLDDYCRQKQLSISQRLALFRKICAAVAYAHQNLVIHRDIKPANIRVTSEGEPKLLDFGVAKLLEADASPVAEQTITMMGVMTPEYASPEQVRGENITTASDVYSLGVVLYELLTEQKPYKIETRSPASVSRAITEQEPTRPSTAIAKGDGSSKPQIPNSKLLRGDLDNIVLTAMRKEPARRYQSVAQFSEDIRRHLEGRPVIARKDTLGYRASKFVTRNKIGVAAAALILLAIIAGSIAALWQASIARNQRDVAQRERLKAERVNTFLQDMLGSAAPLNKGVDVKVVDVLSDASERARKDAANQPELMAGVLSTLGRTYISLDDFPKAEPNLRAALEASTRANGADSPTSATIMQWLGLTLAYQNKTAEGEKIARQAVELQRKYHPQGHEDLGVALYALGLNLAAKNEPKAAEPFLGEASTHIRKYLGEKHGFYMATLTMRAMALERSGKVEPAEALYRQVIDLGENVEPRYRMFRAQAWAYLGNLLINKGAYDEAEKILTKSEALYREILGGEMNTSVATIKQNLGTIYFHRGEYAKAVPQHRKSMEILRKVLTRDNPMATASIGWLGHSLTRNGKPAEGEPYLREALEIRKRTLPKEDLTIPLTESVLGECLTGQKRFADAEPLLTKGFEAIKAKLGDQHRRTIEARQRLAKLYEAWGKTELAEQYRQN